MSEGGYILLYRALLGHPAFRNDAEALAFAWMVARAAWKPARVRYKGRPIDLQRGQLSVSIRDMADALDRDKAWIERLFTRLKRETMIAVTNETGVNVITICNYDKYQSSPETGETVGETPIETGARRTRDTEQRRELREEDSISDADASVAPAPPRPSSEPIDEAVEDWNTAANAAGWPRVTRLGEPRRKALRARLKSEGREGWQAAIARARASPLLSRAPSWFTFDWLTSPKNFDKLSDGNYDRDFRADARNSGGNRGFEGVGRHRDGVLGLFSQGIDP